MWRVAEYSPEPTARDVGTSGAAGSGGTGGAGGDGGTGGEGDGGTANKKLRIM